MLKLELELDKEMHPFNFKLVPQDASDNDILYAFSRRFCSVVNPAVIFAEDVRRGDYNSYTDDEYDRILAVYKKLSNLFREEGSSTVRPNGNLFELFIRLLNHYLSSGQEQAEYAESSRESGKSSEASESSQTTEETEDITEDIEETLVGALLVDTGISKMIRSKLTEKDFTQPDNALLFRSIAESIVSDNELPDIHAIAENYCRKTGCSKADAIDILRGLIAIVPATSGISYYCNLIKMCKSKPNT